VAENELPNRGGIARLYRVIWEHNRGRRAVLIGFLLLLLLAQVARLLIPYFFGEAVNALQQQGAQDLRAAALNIGLMVAAAIGAWALHGPARVLERFAAVRVREGFADALYARASSLPLRWHEGHHSGELVHRFSTSTAAVLGFSQSQFIYIQNLVNLIGPLIALSVISPPIGASALIGYGLIAVLLVRIDGVMVRLAREENRADRRYTAALVDCLGNIATVLTLRLQEATRALVSGRLRETSIPMRRSIVINEVKWGTVDLLNTMLRSGMVVLYAALVYRATGSVLVGTAVMVYQYSQQIGNVVGAMASHWGELVRHQTDLAAADEILEAPTKETAPLQASADWKEIRVDALRFQHPRALRGAPTLDGVSIVLPRGARIAVVGESGSGKSSLLRVLAGLHRADEARVFVDGLLRPGVHDVCEQAVLIPQDPEIFENTLEHNITMGLERSPEEFQRACALACVSSVSQDLPAGLSTHIAERGMNLSGGQKQRIALARGLLAAKDASLVLLDEPTSSIDAVTERMIYDGIFGALGEACIVSSVHRLHLLPRFDRVILLHQGRVLDTGTWSELHQRQPVFRAMWDAQQTEAPALRHDLALKLVAPEDIGARPGTSPP
jgi:ATP-binding cassette subfamily B protein